MNPFTESTVAVPLDETELRASVPLRNQNKFGLTRRHRRRRPAGGAPSSNPPRTDSKALHERRAGRLSWPCTAARALGAVLGVCMVSSVLAIDVNSATQDQLRAVKGIGQKTAQLIIDERARAGRYESIDDLSERVKGIGPKKAASLQAAGLTVGAGSTSATSSSGKGSGAFRVSGAPAGKAGKGSAR